jgi:hypothetical protein
MLKWGPAFVAVLYLAPFFGKIEREDVKVKTRKNVAI